MTEVPKQEWSRTCCNRFRHCTPITNLAFEILTRQVLVVGIRSNDNGYPRRQSQRTTKSARWDGWTFDIQGKIIILSGGWQFCPQTRSWPPPLAHLFILYHRKLPFAHSELLRGGATHDTRGQETHRIRSQNIPSTIDGGRKIATFTKNQTVFAHGDSSDAVFYIQQGKVKLTVVAKSGKEATIAF